MKGAAVYWTPPISKPSLVNAGKATHFRSSISNSVVYFGCRMLTSLRRSAGSSIMAGPSPSAIATSGKRSHRLLLPRSRSQQCAFEARNLSGEAGVGVEGRLRYRLWYKTGGIWLRNTRTAQEAATQDRLLPSLFQHWLDLPRLYPPRFRIQRTGGLDGSRSLVP